MTPLMPRQYGHSTIPTELLRSFIAISEHGSFTKAAQELNLTQPAISAQMKRLQQMLGGDLLVKKGQGIGLTELGSIIESYARRVLALNDQIIAIAGRVPKGKTLYIGIQSMFVRSVLSHVVRKLPGADKGSYRFISGNAIYLAENLRSGYLDLVFMLVQSGSRRGLVVDWPEKLAWVHAPHFVVPDDAPIPYLSRHEGYIDRKVLDLFEESNVPYRIAFSTVDLWNLAAAAEAGVGVLVTLDRLKSDLSRSLVIAKNEILPKLPELRAGVFFKEGFDVERNQAIVQAFVSAVRPRDTNKHS
ncbi:MAG TPA: LysR family transcriptional regulator [Stellaceae bacterium]|nr:LysR family transcriptional regulator [Stellaceae bacterium]